MWLENNGAVHVSDRCCFFFLFCHSIRMMLVGLGRPGGNKIAIWRRLMPTSYYPPPLLLFFYIWIVLSFKGRPLQSVHSRTACTASWRATIKANRGEGKQCVDRLLYWMNIFSGGCSSPIAAARLLLVVPAGAGRPSALRGLLDVCQRCCQL